uniref:HDC00966 n=1 Tax=Drosophila melanogaster TaxID=7227 RepID=Q6IHU0_DROME|nr:TPA_inf: HDC00966 [Drosophila melanogaster]
MRAGQDMCVGVDVDVDVDVNVDVDKDWDWGQVARVVGWWWAYASVAGLVAGLNSGKRIECASNRSPTLIVLYWQSSERSTPALDHLNHPSTESSHPLAITLVVRQTSVERPALKCQCANTEKTGVVREGESSGRADTLSSTFQPEVCQQLWHVLDIVVVYIFG